MRHLPLLSACLAILVATPVLADDLVTMTIVNRGTDTVSGINSFPIGDDGEVIDDNIGGLYDDVPPGSQASFELSLYDCAPVRFYVRLASFAATETDDLTINVDTCTDRTIVVTD